MKAFADDMLWYLVHHLTLEIPLLLGLHLGLAFSHQPGLNHLSLVGLAAYKWKFLTFQDHITSKILTQ